MPPRYTKAEKSMSQQEKLDTQAIDEKVIINDKLVRIIGIQFFGIVIPNATGLITNNDRSITYLMLNYGYFMLIAFLIWQGNRFILFKLESKYDWFINPAQKVIFLVGANIFYTGPLVTGMLLLWYYFTGNPVSWEVIKITSVVCIVCVIFISQVYETVFLIKQRESDIVKSTKLESARVQAQLEALKNQIDPHFMFNSLNSLTHLIDKDTSLAKEFTKSLSEVYRYILSNKDQKLVILEDELLFLNKYISLLKLRFNDSLEVKTNINDSVKNNFLIPPISIFFALENVVKHNEISSRYPMQVDILQDTENLWVSNKIKKKKTLQHSSKIGLKNLDERFKIIVGRGVSTSIEDEHFKLQLPLLPISG